MNRVAITGLGVISPVGQDIETVYANLRDGVCGVGRITRFDPSETKISVAAEVKDFDPEAFGISRGDTRRMDLFTQYAMAAAQQAVDDSGIVGAVAPERLGGVCTLGAFTLALELLLGVCCAYVGGDWFFVAGMSVLFGLGLLFLPYVLKRLPLPENVKTRRAALSLGLDLALLLGLLAVCCTHVDGDWFWITAVSVVYACSVLILPFVIRQLPLPGRLAEHRAALWLGVCSLLLFVLLGAARLYGGGDWFLLPGLPMALYGLALPWGLLLALRYLRAGGLYRAAAAAGFAALWYWLFPWVLDRVMALDGLDAEPPYSLLRPFGFELGDWSPASTASNVMFLILLALVLTALTLLLCALFRGRRKNRPAPPREPQN